MQFWSWEIANIHVHHSEKKKEIDWYAIDKKYRIWDYKETLIWTSRKKWIQQNWGRRGSKGKYNTHIHFQNI